jgi:hypothetical protein
MLMGDAEERNDTRAGKKNDLSTAGFSGSAPVVVHWTSGSIISFDFLNMNGYSTGVLAKGNNKE